MEQIIQLKEKEYSELVKNSNANKKIIEETANRLYEEKGTFAIKLRVEIGEYEDNIKIIANGYISDWDDKFPLKNEDKKKILKFAKQRAEGLMEKYLSDVILDANYLKSARKEYNDKVKLFSIITITGWLVALLVTGITVYYA